jgi:Protein of unknown function (DUF2710)
VTGSDGDERLADKALVDAVLRELSEAAEKWEALVAESAKITYTVDLGDIHAIANSDGKLLELTLHPQAVSEYSHGELAARLNAAFAALREEAEADNAARYGGRLH